MEVNEVTGNIFQVETTKLLEIHVGLYYDANKKKKMTAEVTSDG